MADSRIRRIDTNTYGHPKSSFTQAYEIPGGTGLVFLSGITSRAADASILGIADVARQCTEIFKSIERILQSAGLGLDAVIKTNAYVTQPECMETYRRIKQEFLGDPGPPGTVVQVVALYDPAQLIEIEAIAIR